MTNLKWSTQLLIKIFRRQRRNYQSAGVSRQREAQVKRMGGKCNG